MQRFGLEQTSIHLTRLILRPPPFQFESDEVDENGPEVVGRFFFNEATFGVDVDGVDGVDGIRPVLITFGVRQVAQPMRIEKHFSGGLRKLAQAAGCGDAERVAELIKGKKRDSNALSEEGMPLLLWPVHQRNFVKKT